MTTRLLLRWARRNVAAFLCCSPTLSITDDYNGGATFLAFLADDFGEDIHVRLLQNPSSTFAEALAMETRPYSLVELFGRFREWPDKKEP